MVEKIQLDIASLRREYTQGGLRRKDLTDQPLVLFERWLKQAYEAKLADPTAMSVATVDSDGQPYQRIVLLKHYDKNGLIFYTNLSSRKAQHIAHNNKVSLLFPWYQLERQVCFLGEAEKLTPLEVIKYFHSRPKDSQIAAWASQQSAKISARSLLENKFFELKKNLKMVKFPYLVFGAAIASDLTVLNFGKVALNGYMIDFCINGNMIIGKLIAWRHKRKK